MKFIKKRNQYEASNVTFNADKIEAYSYGWWKFVAVIGGKVVFNTYNYSSSTIKHQIKVKRLMRELGINIDIEIKCPKGFQSDIALQSVVEHYKYRVKQIKDKLENTKRRKALDGERMEAIKALMDEEYEFKKLYFPTEMECVLS
jgi:hypothetical protein